MRREITPFHIIGFMVMLAVIGSFAMAIEMQAKAYLAVPNSEQQLKRIADATERQAKSLESIERWLWEPETSTLRLREHAGVFGSTGNWVDSFLLGMVDPPLIGPMKEPEPLVCAPRLDNQYIYDYR
jgi:hypothetical protein